MTRALACNTGRYSATAKRPLPDRAAERLDRFVGIGAETGVRVAVAEAEHAAAHPVARALERFDRTRIAELDELRDRGLAIGARLAVLEVEQRRLERGVAIARRLDRRQERRWWWWWRIVADVVAIGPVAIRAIGVVLVLLVALVVVAIALVALVVVANVRVPFPRLPGPLRVLPA